MKDPGALIGRAAAAGASDVEALTEHHAPWGDSPTRRLHRSIRPSLVGWRPVAACSVLAIAPTMVRPHRGQALLTRFRSSVVLFMPRGSDPKAKRLRRMTAVGHDRYRRARARGVNDAGNGRPLPVDASSDHAGAASAADACVRAMPSARRVPSRLLLGDRASQLVGCAPGRVRFSQPLLLMVFSVMHSAGRR